MMWYLYPLIFSIICAQFIGHFGNFNLALLHYRLPKLRTNYGWLLTILTVCQTVCLFSENVNLFYAIYGKVLGHPIYRDACFHRIFFYIFFNAFQQGIVLVIAVDLLICVLLPIKYRTFRQPYYLTLLLILPALHGVFLVVTGFVNTDSNEIKLCNPPSALPPMTNAINYFITLCVCSVTIIVYSATFLLVYLKTRQKTRVDIESKTLRSLSVIAIVFIITRLLGMIIINIQQALRSSAETIIVTQNLLVIPALVGFSQNFYVCYFRSKEYREMLNEQLLPLIRLFRPHHEIHKVFVLDGMSKLNSTRA